MGAFFIYILKSSVCLVLFYLFFRVLLSKETFHRFNRVALLGVLFLSLLIPFIEVTTNHQVEVQQTMLTIEQVLLMAEMEPATVDATGGVAVHEVASLSWIEILLLVRIIRIYDGQILIAFISVFIYPFYGIALFAEFLEFAFRGGTDFRRGKVALIYIFLHFQLRFCCTVIGKQARLRNMKRHF